MRFEATVRGLSLLLTTLALARASAAEYYVSTQGNDANAGTAAQPVRTITRAYSLAAAGDTITVLPGVYTDYTKSWGLRLGKSGTASNPITLRSQVRGGAVLDGQNGADRNKTIYLDGSYNIVEGFQIRGGPNGGVTIWGNFNQILNNEIHHNGNLASDSTFGRDGVYSDRTTRDNIYRGNYIHDNGRSGARSNLDHGLYLCGDNELAVNNALVRNSGSGIQVAGYSTVQNLKIYNNVMAHNGTQGIILWLDLNGVDIKNNIFFGNATYGINSYDAHGGGVVIDSNLAFGNILGNYALDRGESDFAYTMGTTISIAPLFVNSTVAGFDAHLSAGSPAINTARNLSSSFTTDMDGATRPASGPWDLGVYKYGATATIPPVVALTAPANGADYTAPATIDLAAAVTANGNTISKVQFLHGATLVGEDTAAPYAFTWSNVAAGSYSLSARAVYDGSTATSLAASVAVAAAPPTSGLTLGTSSGTVTAPFVVTNDTISQPSHTSLTEGGRAVYTFTISTPGDYSVAAMVNAPGDDANSFFVNVDAEPTDPEMIWDMPVTVGLAERVVAWRGNGTYDNSQFAPKVFQLAAGAHTLIVRGREANCQLGTITLSPYTNTAPVAPVVTMTALDANASRVGPDNGTFAIARTGSASTSLTVSYSLGGTAVNGTDYETLALSATIPAGAASAIVTVEPKASALLVHAKTVTMTLSAGAAYEVGAASGASVAIAGNSVPTGSIKATGNSVTIGWASMAGRTYRVAGKDSLAEILWTDLSGTIAATGTSTSWVDQNANRFKQRYYMVYVTN